MKLDGNKSVKIYTQQIIPVVGFAIGLVFLVIGVRQFGFWNNLTSAPTEGFFPIIVSTLLCVLSVVGFIQSIRKEKVEYRLLNWYVPIGFLLFIVSIMIIGTIPSIILLEVLWCRFYEKLSWKTTAIATVFCLILALPVFTMWLQIDFPLGIIGNLIMGY